MESANKGLDKQSYPFIIPVALVLGIFIGMGVLQTVNAVNQYSPNQTIQVNDSEYVNDIYQLLQDKFLGQIPQGKELDYAKVKGIIDSLDSKYTSFLTPEEASAYKESEDPNFEGIGVSLKFDGENTEVETVMSNYPAEKAGMRAKDIIVKVDNVDVKGKYPSEVAGKIRGKAGTKVKVEVIRPSTVETLSFDITREQIDIDNISYEKLDNGVYKINIFQFIDKTPEQLNKSWDKIVNEISSKNDAKGIIVDLRNNPGGYVYSVRYILEEFFPTGTILMKEREKDSAETVYKDNRSGKFENMPLTVIVNEGSASASEIFSAAIQDNNRGKVVGTKTVGKGVEQQALELSDGSMLIVVFQEWLTPTGRNITEEDPITPNFEVEYSEEDFENLRDPQLDKALEVVRGL